MGKSSGGGTQTVINKTDIPQFIQDAAQKNLNAAYNVSANMMGPYTGQRVADMTGNQLADINAVQNNVGATAPAFNYAQSTAAGLTNYQPGQVQSGMVDPSLVQTGQVNAAMVNPGSLAGTNLSSYMNPYTQNVINSGLQALDIQRQQALNQIGDQAIRTGAFGGSRQGIQEGITNAASAMQAGNLAAQLQSQNFAQAQAAAQNDLARNLQAQGMNQQTGLNAQQFNQQLGLQGQLANQAALMNAQQYNNSNNLQAQLANQQAGLQGAGLNLTAANNLGSLASQGQNSFLQGAAAGLTGQEAIQAQNQAQLQAAQQAYQEQQQFPLQQLQVPLQALGATPYGQTNTQTGPGPTSNLGLSLLGGGLAGARIGAMIPGVGSGFGALGGLLLGGL
jgi:hypothetical protein